MGDKMQEVKQITVLFLILLSFVHCTDHHFSCALRETVFDKEGNILEEKAMDANEVERRKKIATIRNKVEDLIQRAKSSNEGMDLLLSTVMNIETSFSQIVPSTVQAPQQEYETFIGCKIPEQIEIHPPTDVRSKGRSKRIKRAKELPKPRKGKNSKIVTKEAH
jgi:hypothetical protein